MSINAVISNEIATHIGNFNINIAFAKDVDNFVITDFTFTAVSGNGLNNITRILTGSGSTYMVNVSVPSNVAGAFSVEITGHVTVDGSPQSVVATAKTFRYDTIFDVRTAFKSLQYNDPEYEIVLPISFDESVLWFDKSDLSIEKKVGSEPYLLEHYVRGKDANYDVVFHPEGGTWGAICVDITGEVIKEEGLLREIINIDPVLISYNHLTPTLANADTPFKSEDGWWNIALEFEHPVLGFGIHSIITGIEHKQTFIYRGQSLDVKPETIPPPFSETYTHEAAQQLHCVGEWVSTNNLKSREQARYFWVKLTSDEDKVPEIFLKDVHGLSPVSVAI